MYFSRPKIFSSRRSHVLEIIISRVYKPKQCIALNEWQRVYIHTVPSFIRRSSESSRDTQRYGSEVAYMAPPVLPHLSELKSLALRVFLNEPQSDYTQGLCTVAKTSRYPTAHCIADHGIPVIPPVELSSSTRKRTLRCSKDWSPWACTHLPYGPLVFPTCGRELDSLSRPTS